MSGYKYTMVAKQYIPDLINVRLKNQDISTYDSNTILNLQLCSLHDRDSSITEGTLAQYAIQPLIRFCKPLPHVWLQVYHGCQTVYCGPNYCKIEKSRYLKS